MRRSYSLYEAKARLSAIIRQVREGQRVVVTVHGEPVAEIRPLAQDALTIAERLDRLAEQGVLVRPADAPPALKAVVRRPGALARFLEERDG
jgi:prevent-host-death family protein